MIILFNRKYGIAILVISIYRITVIPRVSCVVTDIDQLLLEPTTLDQTVTGLTTMASQPRTPEIIKKPGGKSCMWNYFGVEKIGDVIHKDYGICRTCSQKVPSKNGSTSNLLAHLRTKHANLYLEAQSSMAGSSSRASETRPVNQPSIVESIESVQKYERGSRRWKELTDAIVYYIFIQLKSLDSIDLLKVSINAMNSLIDHISQELLFLYCMLK